MDKEWRYGTIHNAVGPHDFYRFKKDPDVAEIRRNKVKDEWIPLKRPVLLFIDEGFHEEPEKWWRKNLELEMKIFPKYFQED